MKLTVAWLLAATILSATPVFAQPPCKIAGQTANLLDEILDHDTLAEIKADKGVHKEALSNIVDILKSDECVGFLLGKSKTKKLAANLLAEKQIGPNKESAAIIGIFLGN